jgi:hypothetical protein
MSYGLYPSRNGYSLVSDAFNSMCTAVGVECQVTPSLVDFSKFYLITNRGKKLVRIKWGTKTEFLEPGEEVKIPVRLDTDLPEIVALNNGV